MEKKKSPKETTLDLEIGKVYYEKTHPHTGLEVVGIKKKRWYLAKFDGSCSKIRPISLTEEADFHENFFETMDEAERAHLEDMKREVERFEEFINDKPEHLQGI